MKVLSAVTLLVVVQFAPASAAQASDAALAHAAVRSVSSYTRYTVFDDVSVRVEAGEIVLSGKVTQPVKRDELGRRVAGIQGARGVRNDLEVLPVSIGDDRLRRSVARAIYGSPTFWRFAAMPNPPIHIIVEHGRVTLDGVVNSNVDRMLARSIASSFLSLGPINVQLKTNAEAREEMEKI